MKHSDQAELRKPRRTRNRHLRIGHVYLRSSSARLAANAKRAADRGRTKRATRSPNGEGRAGKTGAEETCNVGSKGKIDIIDDYRLAVGGR